MPNDTLCLRVSECTANISVSSHNIHGSPSNETMTRNPKLFSPFSPFETTKQNDKELLQQFKIIYPDAAGWEFKENSWMLLKTGWSMPAPEVCIRKEWLEEFPPRVATLPKKNTSR